MQQLQNPIAGALANSPNNGMSAVDHAARMDGQANTSSFTMDKPTSVDPLKVPAPVEPTPYRIKFNHDGKGGM